MRIHVLGIGSIGSLFAFHLRRSLPAETYPISLIVRKKKTIENLNDDQGQSIRVERDGTTEVATGFDPEIWEMSSDQIFSLMYDRNGALKTPSEGPNDPGAGLIKGNKRVRRKPDRKPDIGQAHIIDSLIVTCKAPATLPAIQRIVPRLHSNSTIVLLQNGMGVYDQLVDRLFPDPAKRPHFILASTTHGVWAKGPLSVVHAGVGDFSFGIMPDPRGRRNYESSLGTGFSHLQLSDISPDPTEEEEFRTLYGTVRALLSLRDLSPHWEPIQAMHLKLLKKLAVNCVVNPLTALMNITNGELLGSTEAYNILRSVCREASAVFRAQAAGADPLVSATVAQHQLSSPKLEEETTRVLGHTARNYSSMLQDIRSGKPTEIEFMNGYLARMGQSLKVPTPVNQTLRGMVRLKSSIGQPTELPGVMRYWHPLGEWKTGKPPALTGVSPEDVRKGASRL